MGSLAFVAVSNDCTDFAGQLICLYIGKQIAHIVIDKCYNLKITDVY